jgi:SNF2 family DNA or RNA helicase
MNHPDLPPSWRIGVSHDSITDNHIALSGKLKQLEIILEKYAARQDRVLLFSYSTKTLAIIKQFIKTKYKHAYLDGKTSTKERTALVDKFQKGKFYSKCKQAKFLPSTFPSFPLLQA